MGDNHAPIFGAKNGTDERDGGNSLREAIRIAAASLRWPLHAARAQPARGLRTRRWDWRHWIPSIPAFLLFLPAGVRAQEHTSAPTQQVTLPTVVVTATRSPQRAFDVPASVDAVSLDTPGGDRPNVNPSEALQAVPGVLARDRQNYAQDEQISIRGFGARSSFGVRGVRLYVDGIPATMPDGQGQSSNFSLSAANRIEVLRGPFSALYGNSSGGVIQIFTADGTPWPEQRFGVDAGPYGAVHMDANARGAAGALAYNADVEQFRTSGFRDHSAARRAKGNLKLTSGTPGGGELTLLLNSVWLRADDPQGLTC